MNKRTLAVLAGTILLQTAAFAADSTETRTQSKDSAKVECDKAKCDKAEAKAAKKKAKVSKAKEANKSVASAEAQIGAY